MKARTKPSYSAEGTRRARITGRYALLVFLSYLIWSHLSTANRIESYHSDCSPLFQKHPTSACYESNAFATFHDRRNIEGDSVWYYVNFKLPGGQEISTSPKLLDRPSWLDAASVSGICRVRIWQSKIVEVRNSHIYFITKENPEADILPSWIYILALITTLANIIWLAMEIKAKRRQKSQAETSH